ncbi:MAG: YjfB family protein [Chromatiaceae bacterium]|nr:YjfB family protein [Chromatiaceae bacterium]MCP5315445.1 YjfB family protein [Chromatiaceae bacterium]
MDISAISSSLIQQINGDATQSGDAVAISVLRKALDLQSTQAAQLIASVAASVPDPASAVGHHVDVRA